jgi:hypothetical protein
MDARDLRLRHGEHAEGVVVAQVFLGGEGKLREVLQFLQVVGVHAPGVKGLAVVRNILVNAVQRVPEPPDLQGGDLVAAGPLYRVQQVGGCGVGWHRLSPFLFVCRI